MKHAGALVASRPVARHCAELLRAGPSPEELRSRLAEAGEAIARALPRALAPLSGGSLPTVKAAAAWTTGADVLTAREDALAACLLLEGGLAAAIDGAAVLRMVDRTFGGRGEAPAPLPADFPVTANLLIDRLEALLIAAIGPALSLAGPALSVVRRAPGLSQLRTLSADDEIALLTFEVTESTGDHWEIALTLPAAALASAFAAAPARPGRQAAADPLAEPFGDLPLNLSAVLVDMRLPMAVVAGLAPGMILPVSVARKVPLRLGKTTVAAGSVGAADDRVAIQITEITR